MKKRELNRHDFLEPVFAIIYVDHSADIITYDSRLFNYEFDW